jgi:thiosulfate reductase cytochrome b subunit
MVENANSALARKARDDANDNFEKGFSCTVTETVQLRWYYRHPVAVRFNHWINATCLLVLLMSGLQIFNAHPALYWGMVSTFDTPLVSIQASEDDPPKGITSVFGKSLDTTGWLGSFPPSGDAESDDADRAFPGWATLPTSQDLATGRRWHFLFAWFFVVNGLIYLVYGFATKRFNRHIVPTWAQLKNIGPSIRDHLLLRFPHGEEAKDYNVLQKLSYLIVIFVLLPVQILAGLTMSPGMNAAAPFLLDLFGGRQSARTIHFAVASLLVLFVIVHVAMVVVSGLRNNLRSMFTGWYVIDRRRVDTPSKLEETL